MTYRDIELTDERYSYDHRCPHYIDYDVIGTCDICGDEVYNNEDYEYKSIYSVIHISCKREQLREFISKYNNRIGHEPKRFRMVRD